LAVYPGCVVSYLALVIVPIEFPRPERLLAQGVPAIVLLTAAVQLNRSGSVVRPPWILLLGDASYSIYLTQPFVAQAVQKVAQLIGLTPALAILWTVLTLSLICVTGVFVHRAVEKPLIRMTKRLIESLRYPTPSAPVPTAGALPPPSRR
jgi:exopolysaccharide production protein ExoZ